MFAEELQGEAYQASDLNMFFQMYAPDQVGNLPVLVSIDGGKFRGVTIAQSEDRFVVVGQAISAFLLMLAKRSWTLSL